MKKSIVIAIQLMSLSAILAVSTFAWFKVTFNSGQPTVTIPTDDKGSEFVFAKNEFIEEALAPAKLKKGVLSGAGKIDENDVPTGEGLLPRTKVVDGKTVYDVTDDGRMQFKNDANLDDYFEYPSTLIYSQYRFIASGENMRFTFEVYYPKLNETIDDEAELDISKFNKLKQIETLNFNFFVTPYESTYTLSQEELQKASTSIGTANAGKITIENTLANKVTSSTDHMILCGKGTPINIDGTGSSKENQVKSGRINTVKNKNASTNSYTYTFELTNLPVTQFAGYNLIVEAYYALPDMLIDGNVPLNGEFVLMFNVSRFTPTTSS